jgi:hypothetical protein
MRWLASIFRSAARAAAMVDGGRQVFVFDHGLGGGGAGGGDRGGGHGEQALADADHLAVGEQLVVADHRADVVLAGDVGGGQHEHHAGRGAHGRQVHRHDPRMGRLLMPRWTWSMPAGSGMSST